jgi:hypothetical protein
MPVAYRADSAHVVGNLYFRSTGTKMQIDCTIAPAVSQSLRACQTGRCFETDSLYLPQAALRLFPLASTISI